MPKPELSSPEDRARMVDVLTEWEARCERSIWVDMVLLAYAREMPPGVVLQLVRDFQQSEEDLAELKRDAVHKDQVIKSLAAKRDDSSRRRQVVKEALGNRFDATLWPEGMEWEQAAAQIIREARDHIKRFERLRTRVEMGADAKENALLRCVLVEIAEVISTPDSAVGGSELVMWILRKINAVLENVPDPETSDE